MERVSSSGHKREPRPSWEGGHTLPHTPTSVQGFNEEVICILRKRYPAELLATLQSQSHGALRDICDAFPDDSILANARLKRFLEVGRLKQTKMDQSQSVKCLDDSLHLGHQT